MKSQIKALCAGLALLALPIQANAAVILGEVTGGNAGGIFEEVTPTAGFAVGNNNQNSPNLFAFNEAQGATLLSDIGGISAGTLVDSHYVWFDPASLSRIIGTITFDEPILAIFTTTADLAATDYLGNPLVTYNSPGLRGLESGDNATFAGNTVSVDFSAGSPGDYIRVLTLGEISSSIPEPSTWLMLLIGFFGVGAGLRRQRATALEARRAL